MRPAFLTRFITRMAQTPESQKTSEFLEYTSEKINEASSNAMNSTIVRYHGLTQAEVDHIVECIRKKGYFVIVENLNNMRISW